MTEPFNLVRRDICAMCGSSLKELDAFIKVAEAAMQASKIINLQPNIHEENDLWYARDQIDLALRKLDEARRW